MIIIKFLEKKKTTIIGIATINQQIERLNHGIRSGESLGNSSLGDEENSPYYFNDYDPKLALSYSHKRISVGQLSPQISFAKVEKYSSQDLMKKALLKSITQSPSHSPTNKHKLSITMNNEYSLPESDVSSMEGKNEEIFASELSNSSNNLFSTGCVEEKNQQAKELPIRKHRDSLQYFPETLLDSLGLEHQLDLIFEEQGKKPRKNCSFTQELIEGYEYEKDPRSNRSCILDNYLKPREEQKHLAFQRSNSLELPERYDAEERVKSEMEETKITFEDFTIIKGLSYGAYGQVCLAQKKSSGDYFAMKIIDREKTLEMDQEEYIKSELQ